MSEQNIELFAALAQVKKAKRMGLKTYLTNLNYTEDEIYDTLTRFKQWESYQEQERYLDAVVGDYSEPAEEPAVGCMSDEDEYEATALNFHSEKYVYNEDTDTYIVPLKCAPKPLVMKGDDHRAICANYSNWVGKGMSINEIARKFKMPRQYFNEYKTVFSLTHDREPLTAEQILASDTGSSVDHILEEKRFAIHQQFEKESWKRTQADAEKWRSIQARELDPFQKFLENYVPKPLEPAGFLHELNADMTGTSEKVFVTGLSDLHFGVVAHSEKLFKGRELSTEIISQVVDNYAQQIADTVADSTTGYAKCVVFAIGDILHGIRGKTERGTVLECDTFKEDQFTYAFDTLIRYFQRMIEIFGTVEVHSVRGNHDGIDNWMLINAIAVFFKDDIRITFNNYKTRSALVRVNSTLFIIDHGESDTYKHAAVPAGGKPRESYVQSLLLTDPSKLVGVVDKVFVQGHLHHFELHEYNDFTFLMFSSVVTGDAYSADHNWNARPRQNCLVIGNDGIKQTLHYYFDNLTAKRG
jgi:hypothetical protein